VTDTARLLHHRTEGPEDGPALILGPSLGTSTGLWDPQLPALARRHRVLRFDLPGHGGSPTGLLARPEPGATTIGDLASLVLALADHHGLERFHYAGVSLGGAIGTWLASRHPDRVASLGLVCTSAHFGGPGPWLERAALVRDKGMDPVVDATPARWFALPGTATTPRGAALLADLAAADPTGYAACCDALASLDLRDDLRRVTAPTLVVAGSGDVATPVPHAEELADGIRGAVLRILDAGHIAPTERPAEVTRLLVAHLDEHSRS
jgi:3-oxoadipate enol-lactonase